VPKHLQRKVARKVKFLERVAASRPDTLAPRSSIKKKRRRRPREGLGPLGTLGALADSLAEAAKEEQSRGERRLKGLGVHGTRKRLNIAKKVVLLRSLFLFVLLVILNLCLSFGSVLFFSFILQFTPNGHAQFLFILQVCCRLKVSPSTAESPA
jgi:hypothetical protein